MRSTLLALVLAAAAPGCVAGEITGGGPGEIGGGGGGGGGGPVDTGRIAVTVDQTSVSTELGQTVQLTYTIASVNGYAGSVSVTPTVKDSTGTAVPGWTLTPDSTSLTIAADGTASLGMTVMIPTNDAELAPIVSLGLSDGMSTADVASNFTVKNQVTIMLDVAGSASGTHTSWPAKNAPIRIKKGATVIFHNGDVVPHEIHSGGGVPHESGSLAPGAEYMTANVQQEADWYCHNHEGGGDTRAILVE